MRAFAARWSGRLQPGCNGSCQAVDMDISALGERGITRTPFDVVEAYSGARLERVELTDGQVVVAKHLPAEGDWLTRVTDGLGRAHLLWHSGLLRRLEPAVEHGILAVERQDDHDVVVMTDLSERLWPHTAPLDRSTVRGALAGLGELHRLGQRVVAGDDFGELQLCTVGARYGMFARPFQIDDSGPNRHPGRDRILAGWDVFGEAVDTDVRDAVAVVHADPEGFGRRLAAHCTSRTVLHGDMKPENLGMRGGRLIAIDWGELTGFGPREVDVAWFALMSTRARLDATPDEVFSVYEEVTASALDPTILDLACIGSLAQMGFRLAGAARFGSRPEERHAAAARLAWWTGRVRAALARGRTP
jgi:hypothetical protein